MSSTMLSGRNREGGFLFNGELEFKIINNDYRVGLAVDACLALNS